VSDVREDVSSFFTLFGLGLVDKDRIHDFVDAWHESGDDEKRTLEDYLGMTDEEYSVWLMAPNALPVILAARRDKRPIRETIVPFFESMRAAGDPEDRPAIFALGHWLRRHEPG